MRLLPAARHAVLGSPAALEVGAPAGRGSALDVLEEDAAGACSHTIDPVIDDERYCVDPVFRDDEG